MISVSFNAMKKCSKLGKIIKPWQKHVSNMNSKDLKPFRIDHRKINKYVASARAGCSVICCSLPAFTNKDYRAKVECLIRMGFDSLSGDIKGTYYEPVR